MEALTGTSLVGSMPNTSRVVAAASTNLNTLKASSGNVYGWAFYNTAAYDVFVKLYDKASNPVLASDTPKFTIKVKAGAETILDLSTPIPFANGIAIAMTKLIADTDTTVLVANDVTGFIRII